MILYTLQLNEYRQRVIIKYVCDETRYDRLLNLLYNSIKWLSAWCDTVVFDRLVWRIFSPNLKKFFFIIGLLCMALRRRKHWRSWPKIRLSLRVLHTSRGIINLIIRYTVFNSKIKHFFFIKATYSVSFHWQDHDKLIEELKYFERIDRQRRQDIVSKIPVSFCRVVGATLKVCVCVAGGGGGKKGTGVSGGPLKTRLNLKKEYSRPGKSLRINCDPWKYYR